MRRVLRAIERAAMASGSPLEAFAYGCVSRGRAGEELAALGELADAGAIGFSDDGAPVRSAELLRNALLYARCSTARSSITRRTRR